jgi:ATP-binding cassette, subfamily B, bacterial
VGEIFSAVQAIQVAAAEETVLAQLQQVNERRQQMMVRDQLLTGLLDSVFQNMVSLGTGLILIVASQFMQAGREGLSVGDFALFVYSLSFVTDFLYFFGQFIALYKHTEVAFERMEGLLPGTPVATLVAPTPLHLPNLRGHQPPLPPIPQPHRETRDPLQELRVEQLTYTYPGSDGLRPTVGHRGIQDISFSLRQGSLTVITGPIGSGKTTLLRVLLGLLPRQSGSLFWNDRPIPDPATFLVPPRSAYTPQIPQLFSSSLQENLLLGLEPDPHILRQAIHLAVFEQDLAAMPEGLNTLVGPKGMRLSGGQQQRAAATRMFVRQPELLVFDDLSSALDVETEQRLWQRLFSLRSKPSLDGSATPWNPTCLVVSHRPALLRRADQILVLQEGRVVWQGPWEKLRQTCPDLLPI